PEKLASLLAAQGGRMLLASAEGTVFEIAKGRYSERANFDVFLKAHAGDPLRVARIGRPDEVVDQPALTVAVAVPPAVLQGLSGETTLAGGGYLARPLYAVPRSLVGRRKVAAAAVRDQTDRDYVRNVRQLWSLTGTISEGQPAPHWLRLTSEADAVVRG